MPARAKSREAAEVSLRDRVEAALEIIRPGLRADGGDIILFEISDDGVVNLKLVGACGECPMSPMTLKMGIEDHLRRVVPEVVRVNEI